MIASTNRIQPLLRFYFLSLSFASSTLVLGCLVLTTDTGTGGGPPVTSTGTGGGAPTNCGDAVLDSDEECDDGNNAPNDGCTNCKIDECFTCSVGPGKISICKPVMAGQTCQMTKFCDSQGACVGCIEDSTCNGGYCANGMCAKCDDATKNGDETDVDCGGLHCPMCPQGKTCSIGGDCTSTFCTDGVCCDIACDGACLACNIAGSKGTCDFIPKYGEDQNYGSGMTCLNADNLACSGGGTCGKAVGSACGSPAECASTKCGDPDMDAFKTCTALTGEPCAANGDCTSNVCTSNVCE